MQIVYVSMAEFPITISWLPPSGSFFETFDENQILLSISRATSKKVCLCC